MKQIYNTRQAVLEYIEECTEHDKMIIHNEYSNVNRLLDNYIYYNDAEFFATMFCNSIDAVRAVCMGNFNYSDKFVQFNGYGNLETFNYIDIDDDVIDTIMNRPACFNIELIEE